MKFLLIIIDPDGREHVEPTRYDYYAQAEMAGKYMTSGLDGWTYYVKQVQA